MTRATLMRTTILAVPVAMLGLASSQTTLAADRIVSDHGGGSQRHETAHMYGDGVTRSLPLGVGKSVVIDLPRDIKDVLVADPKIANAVVRTARRAYMIGVAVGQTNVFFFDGEGRQIAGFDIAVKRDLNGMRAALKRLMPDADIEVEGLAEGVVLSGEVSSPLEAQQAFDLATQLAGDGAKVVNAITVRGSDQVMIRVAVAEVQRDVIRQLGINMSGSLGYGSSVVNFNTDNPFTAHGQDLSSTALTGSIGSRFSATLRAMERAGVVRTLAEPNLTAISGESASFLAGGEFPIMQLSCTGPGQCTPSVEFKQFGIGLNFTPVVLSGGRISLKVMTEVSELSSEGAIQMQGFTVPALQTRRADTTVEIPSGGSLAMAGLIRENTRQQINGVPGLMNLPVLGTLFKSRDYVNRQTELVVLVTPYVVRAAAAKKLARPDDGFADAADPAAQLLGRFNRLYGVPGKVEPTASLRGRYGFILD